MKNNDYKQIAELVSRVKRQDPDAFAELYNSMYQKVYFLALSIVKDKYLAQDVVQETFINVYKSIHTLGNDMTFIAWINRIAYHCSLKMIAKNEEIPMENSLVEKETMYSSEGEPLDALLSKEERQTLIDHILALPPEYKATMILKYYEGMKLEEIASSMECSVGTVKSRLNRGKKALRKSMMNGGRIFTALVAGGFALSHSIEAYARESSMPVALAKGVLEDSQSKLGISSKAKFQPSEAASSGAQAKWILIGAFTLVLLFGLVRSSDVLTISIHPWSEQYTNCAVPIRFEAASLIPIRSVRVMADGKVLPVAETGTRHEYEVKADANGSYQIEITMWNGQKQTERFEMATIDTTIPELYWYSWDLEKRTFFCLLSDDLSGIDYAKTYQEDDRGNRYPPVSYDEDTGAVEFQLLEIPFYIRIYDNGNNFATYRIESYEERE